MSWRQLRQSVINISAICLPQLLQLELQWHLAGFQVSGFSGACRQETNKQTKKHKAKPNAVQNGCQLSELPCLFPRLLPGNKTFRLLASTQSLLLVESYFYQKV